jgi:allantoate deiminase
MDAPQIIERCRLLAQYSEEFGHTTRTFLSPPMRTVHGHLTEWMEQAGMQVSIDAAGNLRGAYDSARPAARRFYLGSHIDTVPHAGAFDGVLGVMLAVALVQNLAGRTLPFHVEVLAFSEEEGVRFGLPFIGSRALTGDLSDDLLETKDARGIPVREAIRAFGLDPEQIREARADENAIGYFEFHIEQGPVLQKLNLPLGIVESIVGQTRADLTFEGQAAHAGTTPMHLRRDALAGAAEWIAAVEREAKASAGLVASIGRLDVQPGASNVIPSHARATLDVRHANDLLRRGAVERLLGCARQIVDRRGLTLSFEQRLDQASVPMDPPLLQITERAVALSGYAVHRMTSGAGHDAMIMARRMPAAMLFLRSPGGISHNPGETVLPGDVNAALSVGMALLAELETRHA